MRKTASRKAVHLELYARTDLLLAKGRDLDIVTQAELVDPHRPVHEDLLRSSYASYLAELLDRFAEEGEENAEIYELFSGALDAVCAPDMDAPRLQLLARYYEVHLLGLAGYQPQLSVCVDRREIIAPVDQFFGVEEGGVLCPQCGPRHARAVHLSLGALKSLRYLQRSTWAEVAGLRITPPVRGEIERLLGRYITHILERNLKSVEFLKLVRQQG